MTRVHVRMAAAPIGSRGGVLIAVVDDDDDDDGGIRLMGMRCLASGSSNQRCPPSPLLHSPLIRRPRWILTVVMGVCVCLCVCRGG